MTAKNAEIVAAFQLIISYIVENRIFAVSSPSNTRQNQFMLL
jgi:hypothetical protein